MAILATSPEGTRPQLLIQRTSDSGFITPTGDFIDPWLSGLIEDGWELMTSLSRIPINVHNHYLNIQPEQHTGQVIGPKGSVLLSELPPAATEWIQIAVQIGEIEILTGKLGLRASASATAPEVISGIQRGITAGAVVGATVPVRIASPNAT